MPTQAILRTAQRRLLHEAVLRQVHTAVQTERSNGDDQRRQLNLRDGASTSYNIIGQLPCGDTVTVIGEENGWYKVVVPEKEGYVYGGYLNVSESTVAAGDNVDTSSTGTGSTGDTDSGAPLTPDGNLELVDDVYQTSDGKQFITVQSKNDNTFTSSSTGIRTAKTSIF